MYNKSYSEAGRKELPEERSRQVHSRLTAVDAASGSRLFSLIFNGEQIRQSDLGQFFQCEMICLDEAQ